MVSFEIDTLDRMIELNVTALVRFTHVIVAGKKVDETIYSARIDTTFNRVPHFRRVSGPRIPLRLVT